MKHLTRALSRRTGPHHAAALDRPGDRGGRPAGRIARPERRDRRFLRNPHRRRPAHSHPGDRLPRRPRALHAAGGDRRPATGRSAGGAQRGRPRRGGSRPARPRDRRLRQADGRRSRRSKRAIPTASTAPPPIRSTASTSPSRWSPASAPSTACCPAARASASASSAAAASARARCSAPCRATTRPTSRVIAMIGERNREVRGFLENELGPGGPQALGGGRAPLSERPAPLRVRACFVALAIAEYFRDQGANVLLVMDSVTRLAMAQREIGLAAGEPPSQKGYTPSVFNLLPKVLERAGNFGSGSITGFFTVLVEGDDFNEPICDAVRGILDGHFILSRQLGAQGHYPAIDILHSVSRLTSAIATPGAEGGRAQDSRRAGRLSRCRRPDPARRLRVGLQSAARRQHPAAPRAARLPAPGSPGELSAAGDAVAPGRTGRAHGDGPRASARR